MKYGHFGFRVGFEIIDMFCQKVFRSARDELGLSQKDMAAQLGISAQYLGLMERGEQPISQPVAIRMEKLFGFNAEWILFEKGQKMK